MNQKIILTFTILFAVGISYAQQSDYKGVEQVVSYYLDGDTKKDYMLVSRAFHPDALMKHVSSKNGYQQYQALKVFKDQDGKEPEKNRSHRITFINISGQAAVAKVEVEYPHGRVTDYLTLLKVDEKWVIVSKVYDYSRK